MPARVVERWEPGKLIGDRLQLKLEQPRVAFAQDDYYESEGTCFSVVKLTREDLLKALDLLSMVEPPNLHCG